MNKDSIFLPSFYENMKFMDFILTSTSRSDWDRYYKSKTSISSICLAQIQPMLCPQRQNLPIIFATVKLRKREAKK